MSIGANDTNQSYLLSIFKGRDYVVNLTDAIIAKLPPDQQQGNVINSRDEALHFLAAIAGSVIFFFTCYFAAHRLLEKLNT